MCFSVYGSLCLFSPGATVPMLWQRGPAVVRQQCGIFWRGGKGVGLERCASGALRFKKACVRHRNKLRAGSRPRPRFIVNLMRKLRLRDTLVHFLSARSLQTSESRSSYAVVKKKNTQPPPLVCLKALNIAQGPQGEKKSRRRKPGDVVWPHTNKCHSDPGPSSPCVNAM